jgi:hypothetical protein
MARSIFVHHLESAVAKPKSVLVLMTASVVALAFACGDPALDSELLDEDLAFDPETLEREDEGAENDAIEEEEVDVQNLELQATDTRSYGFLPHNRERYYTASNGCRIIVMHGNYLGAIYGKVDLRDCNCIGWATVTAAYANGTMVSNQGKAGNCSTGWSQGTVGPGYGPGLVGTDVTVGNTITGKVSVLKFSGIP